MTYELEVESDDGGWYTERDFTARPHPVDFEFPTVEAAVAYAKANCGSRDWRVVSVHATGSPGSPVWAAEEAAKEVAASLPETLTADSLTRTRDTGQVPFPLAEDTRLRTCTCRVHGLNLIGAVDALEKASKA